MNRLGNGSSFLSQNLLALGLVCELHSQKLTWPLNMGLAKRTVVFQPSIFRCCVTFREGIPELKLSIFEFLTPTMHNLGMAVTALLWEFWKNEWDSWNYFSFSKSTMVVPCGPHVSSRKKNISWLQAQNKRTRGIRGKGSWTIWKGWVASFGKQAKTWTKNTPLLFERPA